MKYVVSVNYISFVFDDGVTAIGFAEIAKTHSEDKDTRVEIEIKGDSADGE